MSKSKRRVAKVRASTAYGKVVPAEAVLEKLVTAVVTAHPDDPSKPGVLLSLLASGEWYASVLRYKGRFGADKFVVCSAKAATMREVIGELARRWLGGSTAKQDLATLLGGKFRWLPADMWVGDGPPTD